MPVIVTRPTRGLVTPMFVLLAASVGLGALALLLQLLNEDWGTPSASGPVSAVSSVLGAATSGVGIALAIVFCIWLHRTLSNARDRYPMAGISPGWAVGSFFVPVAHLVLPYFQVRKGWRAEVSIDERPLAAWFVPWALALAAGYVAGVVGLTLGMRVALSGLGSDEVDVDAVYREIRPLQLLAASISVPLDAIAAYFLARVVRQWTALQERAPVS